MTDTQFLNRYLSENARTYLEQKFYARVADQTQLAAVIHDQNFRAAPEAHTALYSDHSVVHVRDVAHQILHVLDLSTGVLIPARSADRLEKFMKPYGVSVAYLHDIGMRDFTPFARRMHPELASQFIFSSDFDAIVDEIYRPGTFSETDKEYLAQNFTAFFRRDYKRVAELHIESGWVPRDTRVDELEGAVRSVCEPYFDRPLKEISLGMVLMRLFQITRRFNVEIQPQLVLLQKTLLNIEGLGRQLDPDLDLWTTAKPFLERWMEEQVGLGGLEARLKREALQWSFLLPQLPRLVHGALTRHQDADRLIDEVRALRREQQMTNRWYAAATVLLLVVVGLAGWAVMRA